MQDHKRASGNRITLLARLVRFRLEMSPRRRGSSYHKNRKGFWPLWLRANTTMRPSPPGGDVAAVVLVHRRQANLDLQVRLLLATPSVGRVIVSCNNPEVDPSRWCSVRSDRVTFRMDVGRNQTRRYTIAAETEASVFVMLDDDIFIEPGELERLIQELRRDATDPIGMMGQVIRADGSWDGAVTGTGTEVDVLNRMYVCSKAHVAAVFRNAEVLGWTIEDAYEKPADDVLVSFAGPGRPRLVDVDFVDCLSHNHADIATFRQPGFHEARSEWVDRLRRHRDTATDR